VTKSSEVVDVDGFVFKRKRRGTVSAPPMTAYTAAEVDSPAMAQRDQPGNAGAKRDRRITIRGTARDVPASLVLGTADHVRSKSAHAAHVLTALVCGHGIFFFFFEPHMTTADSCGVEL